MTRPAAKNDNTEMLHGAIKLNVNGVPVAIEVPVPANAVKPQTMLPVLQHLTDSCVEMSVENVEKDGKEVSCSKGCNACCHQLVPVSKVEAHNISKLVRNLPAMKKQRVIRRFEKADRKLSELGWFSKMGSGSGLSADDRHDLAMKYFYEGIGCPFLENESCSIYDARPLACREYLVTSPAKNCSSPTEETMEMVPVSLPVSAVVNKLSAEIQSDGKAGYIPLVSALAWCDENPDSFEKKTGPEWMESIMEKLTSRKDSQETPETA